MTENTIWKLHRLLDDTKANHFSLTEKKDIMQAVKKGIKLPLKFNRKIGEYYSQYVCPTCQETQYVTNTNIKRVKRCYNCGQKLDWQEFNKAEENECKLIAKMLTNKE